ncbi:MAG: dTDP-Rha--alpha-D-GlcNAc-pyrophosphate polyprenol alpha-3-L-rhamnosyltransferase [Bacteroidetes bacterium 4572_77]|nr:MAG: dTDP-Rha--alpha-D-GlcNAc-pyrophosphate polyprenol alpha-3-L-rhamnosyltransferase [Bacteroidetes bacterium 4572_77]
MNNLNKPLPLVSIVSVQYGHAEVTVEMVKSLRKITYPNIEIIIVDNASPDEHPELVKKECPEIIYIVSKENLGFAGGNNIGFNVAKGDYVLMLNNDTEVEPDFLEPLVQKMENDKTIGIVSPKIRFYHTPDTLQYVGYDPINSITQRGGAKGFGEKDTGQYEEDAIASYGHGAAMMVSMEVVKKVGLMADIYFLYYEELDWAHRIRDAGYKIYYVHNSLIYHKESVSTGGRVSPLRAYYMTRNRIMYLRRNFHGFTFLMAMMYQLLVAIPKNALLIAVKGNPKYIRAYIMGTGWHIAHAFDKEVHESPQLKEKNK